MVTLYVMKGYLLHDERLCFVRQTVTLRSGIRHGGNAVCCFYPEKSSKKVPESVGKSK